MRLTWWRLPLAVLASTEVLSALDIIPLQPVFTDVGLLLVCLAVWLAFELTSRYLTAWWMVLPGVIALYLDAGGDYWHWYATVPYYDAALHAFGSGAVACWLWGVLRTHGWLVLTSVISLGTVYEIEEYLEDVITGSHRLGDGPDTANDLLMNLLGVSLAIAVIHRRAIIDHVLHRINYGGPARHSRTQ
ncbi:MAG: hypothetical protein HYV33_02540 [Candidatus Kerfeldbacteria bacterium]|nr:hypothetical protein [Candidatus Kerfeldbacteria bacterium]